MRTLPSLLLLAALLALPALAAPPRVLTLPAGTAIDLSAVTDVDSGSLQSGDLITFRILEPVVVQGVTLLAREGAARGVAVYSRGARVGGRGELIVELADVAAVDGTWIPLRVRPEGSGGLAALIPEEQMDLSEPVFPKGRNGMISAKRVYRVWTTAAQSFTVTGDRVPQVARVPLAPPQGARGTPVQVPEGTVVGIHPVAELVTGQVHEGDAVDFVVSQDVLVGGKRVLAAGATAKGTVLVARESGEANKGGLLVLGVDRVATVDGKAIPLRLSSASKGDSNRILSFGVSRVVPLAGLAIRGRQAVVPVDQEFLVGVARDCLVVVP